MASLSDILTTAQNLVQAVNGLAQSYLGVQGTKNQADVSTATLIQSGPGRLATIVVTTAGAVGAVYDANSASLTTNKIYTIQNVVGSYTVNMPTKYGIVIAPGAGQVVAIGYS
jgi:hypothetical protein